MEFVDYERLGSITLGDYMRALERFSTKDCRKHGMAIVLQIFAEQYYI